MCRYGDEYGVGVTQLHVESFPVSTVARSTRVVLERSSVSDADEEERHGEPFGHADNRVLYECPGEPPHGALPFLQPVDYGEGDGVWFWVRQLDERLQ